MTDPVTHHSHPGATACRAPLRDIPRNYTTNPYHVGLPRKDSHDDGYRGIRPLDTRTSSSMPSRKRGRTSLKASPTRFISGRLQSWITDVMRRTNTDPRSLGAAQTALPALVQFGEGLYQIILQKALIVEHPLDTEISCGNNTILEAFSSSNDEGVKGVELGTPPILKKSLARGIPTDGPMEENPLSPRGHPPDEYTDGSGDRANEPHETRQHSQDGPAGPIKGETHKEIHEGYGWETTCNDPKHRDCNERALRKWYEAVMGAGNATHADDTEKCRPLESRSRLLQNLGSRRGWNNFQGKDDSRTSSCPENDGNLNIQNSADDETSGPSSDGGNNSQPVHLSCGAITPGEWYKSMKVMRKIREGKCWVEIEEGTRTEEEM